jgi:hypothetical protein
MTAGDPKSQNKPKFLKARIQIGSCKGPISYQAGQTVFHHDDIPEARRERKREVREWARSKILSGERPEWRKSTTTGFYPVCERRQAELYTRDRSKPYQYNYRAETLDYAHIVEPIDQPQKFHVSRTTTAKAAEIAAIQKKDRLQSGYFKRNQEMPTHPKLENLAPWNNTVTLSPKEREQTLQRMTLKSRAATAKVTRRLGSSEMYKTPYEQSKEISNDVRELKRTGKFNKEEDHTHHHAKVAEQKVSVKNRNAVESSRKYKTNHHSGVWEFNKAEGRYMWSDTGSFVYESKGDIQKIHNPDALNLEGPVQFRPLSGTNLVAVDHVDHR